MKSKYPGSADAFSFNHATNAFDLVGLASLWEVSGWFDASPTSGDDVIGADEVDAAEPPNKFEAVNAVDSAT